jgi:nucleotide-binding universal stress UspA family protein
MFKKILVPLDGSMLAEKALPYAVRLANRLDARLYLVRSVEVPLLTGNVKRVEKELVEDAEAYLGRVTRWISTRTLKPHTDLIRINTRVLRGDPAKEICYYVNSEDIDLVLMSTHGRGGLPRLITGSVAGKILHQLSVPVMLVRPFEQKYSQLLAETFSGVGEPYSDRFQAEGGRVVLTLDGSDLSEAALEPACELALKLKAELHLLRVNYAAMPLLYADLTGMGYASAPIYPDGPEQEAISQAYLTRMAARVVEKGLQPVTAVRSGDVAEQIVEYARLVEADALVMATHAPGDLGWVLTGSTAEEVMRLSHLPVLMLPVHGMRESGKGAYVDELGFLSQHELTGIN